MDHFTRKHFHSLNGAKNIDASLFSFLGKG